MDKLHLDKSHSKLTIIVCSHGNSEYRIGQWLVDPGTRKGGRPVATGGMEGHSVPLDGGRWLRAWTRAWKKRVPKQTDVGMYARVSPLQPLKAKKQSQSHDYKLMFAMRRCDTRRYQVPEILVSIIDLQADRYLI